MSKKLTDLSGYTLVTDEQIKSDRNCLTSLSVHLSNRGTQDVDRGVNEMRDGIAGHLIGFDYVNNLKNGFDCANSNGEMFEVKSINVCAKDWGATFNDTNEEKALSFNSEDVYLQAPVWIDAAKISFFMVGNNPEVGDYLLERVKNYNEKRSSRRSTQTLSVSKLYKDFGFKIVAVDETKEQVANRLKEKYKKAFKNISVDDILTVDEYNEMKK